MPKTQGPNVKPILTGVVFTDPSKKIYKNY